MFPLAPRYQQDRPSCLQWLMPRPIDWVTFGLYVGVLLIYGYLYSLGVYQNGAPWWLGGSLIIVVLAVLIWLDRLEYWYYDNNLSWQKNAAFLLSRLVLIVSVTLVDGLGLPRYELFTLLIPSAIFYLAGGSYGLSGQVWIMFLLSRARTVGQGVPAPPENEPNFFFFLVISLTFIFIITMAYMARQEKRNRMQTEQLLRELKESHNQLREYAEKVAELATTEERNRLAREIHDSLGHYMTVINVQLEKAIAFRDRNPEEADQAVKDAKHLASEALNDIRRSVGALRNSQETFSLDESLRSLVNNMRNGQFSINLEIEGEETGYSRQSLLTLYRAAQEGLTNVQKHAQANQATVQVKLNGQAANLVIQDDGQGFDPTILAGLKAKGHYGLEGLRERLELIRGSLTLESNPDDGTTLSITVPKNPLALRTPSLG